MRKHRKEDRKEETQQKEIEGVKRMKRNTDGK